MLIKMEKKKVKKVVLYPLYEERHQLYKSLSEFPPEGYQFIDYGKQINVGFKKIKKIKIFKVLNFLIKKLVDTSKFRSYFYSRQKSPVDPDIIFSVHTLLKGKKDYVIDCESAKSFAGGDYKLFIKNKKYIEKSLSSKYCQKIIAWSDFAKKGILKNLDCSGFKNKIEVLMPYCTKPKKFKKNYNKKKLKILFVGSSNFPEDIYVKAGKQVLQIFSILSKKHDNIEFIFKNPVPKELKREFGNVKNLKIIDEILPWKEMEKIFQTGDIFLFPMYSLKVILDAMSYGIPIVTSDVWSNSEMIVNGYNGLVVNKSRIIPYYLDYYLPNFRGKDYLKAMKENYDARYINSLVKKVEILIKNQKLRKKMGGNGKKMVATGKFSIKERNGKLKKILDSVKTNNIYSLLHH